eukprot:CAMPEP_0174758050 /NCGR_PEP_ID=MMETSP1094-20130205/107567_1 /TAXON_ID=156173 /ORGANISM="Chrysochromulina brevifilum, Strain UTEX LB 985" /LENGTH=35 /DNA_ID= /DNA_START= /DNA_END= /DNA_ORIENTATION=
MARHGADGSLNEALSWALIQCDPHARARHMRHTST